MKKKERLGVWIVSLGVVSLTLHLFALVGTVPNVLDIITLGVVMLGGLLVVVD